MSVLVVVEVPGGSAALDEALTEAWGTNDDPPAGNRLRLAGPMDGGWRVVSLWDTAEQFEEFLHERIHLTLDEAGEGVPEVTVWEIETVHTFG